MLHPLAWKYETIDPSVLEPINMSVIERAASFVPYIEDGDKELVAAAVNYFLEEQARDAANRRLALAGPLGQLVYIPSPIRFTTNLALVVDPLMETASLCRSSVRHAYTGWLIGVHDSDSESIRTHIDTVQKQSTFEDSVSDPEDLELGLWLELTATPPLPQPLAQVTTEIYLQTPGVQLYKFLPRGSELN